MNRRWVGVILGHRTPTQRLHEGSCPALDVCKSRGFQDKLYDLDKSWENNLVFYGINSIRDEEDRPLLLENRVREILRYAEWRRMLWEACCIRLMIWTSGWILGWPGMSQSWGSRERPPGPTSGAASPSPSTSRSMRTRRRFSGESFPVLSFVSCGLKMLPFCMVLSLVLCFCVKLLCFVL